MEEAQGSKAEDDSQEKIRADNVLLRTDLVLEFPMVKFSQQPPLLPALCLLANLISRNRKSNLNFLTQKLLAVLVNVHQVLAKDGKSVANLSE